MERFEITSRAITAAVLQEGAELCSLRDRAGQEFLWQAGPVWPRHSPNLFPIVGRLTDDQLHHAGTTYRLPQHGFARDRRFAWVGQEPGHCRLQLADDPATHALYPFAFRLVIDYRATDATLLIAYELTNPAETTLPASVGAHPAFAWPLLPGLARNAHRIEFAAAEPGPIRRLKDGLLLPDAVPSPVQGRTLALDEALFAADALIFAPPQSRALRYEAPGGPAIEIAWDGFTDLGIWSRQGGDFLCIEPWRGYASPQGFDGEFSDKPGLMRLAAGETRILTVSITLAG